MSKAFLDTLDQINISKLSSTAKSVMIYFMCRVRAKNPHVYIDTKALAKHFHRAESTIRKALRELVKSGHLVWEGLVLQSAIKVYKLVFSASAAVVSALKKEEEKKPEIKTEVKETKKEKEPLESRASIAEVQGHLRQFNLRHDFIGKLIAEQKPARCRELILEYLDFVRYSDPKLPRLSAQQWFDQAITQGKAKEAFMPLPGQRS